MIQSPALVGLPKKSLCSPSQLDGVIYRSMAAAQGCEFLMPVLFDRRVLGWVASDPWWHPKPGVNFWPGKKKPEMWAGFTSYDDLIAEMSAGKRYRCYFNKAPSSSGTANNWYDMWTIAGDPGAGAYGGTAFTAKQYDDTTAGSIPHGGNVSTDTKHIVNIHASFQTQTPTLIIYDRVLGYEACTYNANSNQAFTNTLTAQRYAGSGEGGLKILFTAQTAHNSTTTNITQLQYTDQDGNTTQSMPTSPTVSIITSATAPTSAAGARVISPATSAATVVWGPYMPLAAGDGGVRLIDNWTTSAANTGSAAIVLIRPLAVVPTVTAGIFHMMDTVQQLAGLERIRDGACLASLVYFVTASAPALMNGGFDVAWG